MTVSCNCNPCRCGQNCPCGARFETHIPEPTSAAKAALGFGDMIVAHLRRAHRSAAI